MEKESTGLRTGRLRGKSINGASVCVVARVVDAMLSAFSYVFGGF